MSTDTADTRLRRDVRLLGDVLGRVMVEQAGPELLDAEERIRLHSRQAREGAPRESADPPDDLIAGIDVDAGGSVVH